MYFPVTLDTKGLEAGFLRDRLRELELEVRVIDAGTQGPPLIKPDVSREEVFRRAGTDFAAITATGDRGNAVTLAAQGVQALVNEAFARGELAGVIGLGGSAGTTIAAHAMRGLPIGFPKLIVSTLASGNTRAFVADQDILLLNSIVDFAGINRVSRAVLNEAAAALAGMVRFRKVHSGSDDRPLVVASMFGVTTLCVQRAREVLEAAGYEVLVFHATGNGGQALESLVRSGLVCGVLDLTTTELADEAVGGILSAGPTRLTAAAETGVPQVVSVGALDMVNFGPFETVPERFHERKFHRHNASVTLMRTTSEECRKLGEEISRKVSSSRGPTSIMLPLHGISAIDRTGQAFDDPAARSALFATIREHAGGIEIVELEHHINDSEFAEAAANKLLALMAQAKKPSLAQ